MKFNIIVGNIHSQIWNKENRKNSFKDTLKQTLVSVLAINIQIDPLQQLILALILIFPLVEIKTSLMFDEMQPMYFKSHGLFYRDRYDKGDI